MMHPTIEPTRLAGECMPLMQLTIRFKGKSTHSSSHPDKGVNYLSAVTLYFVATGLLRQYFKEVMRLPGIIVEGGNATEMIPEDVLIKGIKGSIVPSTCQHLETM